MLAFCLLLVMLPALGYDIYSNCLGVAHILQTNAVWYFNWGLAGSFSFFLSFFSWALAREKSFLKTVSLALLIIVLGISLTTSYAGFLKLSHARIALSNAGQLMGLGFLAIFCSVATIIIGWIIHEKENEK